jgi:hypothetical protein
MYNGGSGVRLGVRHGAGGEVKRDVLARISDSREGGLPEVVCKATA